MKNPPRQPKMLLLDIGNTHTHAGTATAQRVLRHRTIPTAAWFSGTMAAELKSPFGKTPVAGIAACSVVPDAMPALDELAKQWRVPLMSLTPKTLKGLGIDYPHPKSIGPDRLANALAAKTFFGCPVVVVDFGTAVTFDVVDRSGRYIGGVIAPGLAAMTDYLHDRTALLPKIRIRDVKTTIGKSTREAMLIGAVHGYRGLIKELLSKIKHQLNTENLHTVATGGYAELLAAGLPEIQSVEPLLTLEGLRLNYCNRFLVTGPES